MSKEGKTDISEYQQKHKEQYQIDILTAIVNELTDDASTQVKAIDHIVNRLDKIENFLDQISREVEKDNNVDRIVH
tara:strand:+ start:62 stop:289 length:228 start_codon:yes stop_codon:yes gene_type:complete